MALSRYAAAPEASRNSIVDRGDSSTRESYCALSEGIERIAQKLAGVSHRGVLR